MDKIAAIVPNETPFSKYEFLTLSIDENGSIYFQSEFHFSRLPLRNEDELIQQLKANVINVIVIKPSLQLKSIYHLSREVIEQNPDECYLNLGFVNSLQQIQKERELWRVQMQDQLKKYIRGIDGPCEKVYKPQLLDVFVMALSTIKNLLRSQK
ncbi:hypothetical protein [Tepidibacillus fermentans]|uniref:Uncharacterized protein n=1 Tax=Tepidibacillus fermentans TaxID=1281767 RepID=A0A4R3KJK3_9BACI|nr:hypothetical protein [Tepidibacillus fermentans]TCS83692.1 hypothetical protein EDD72_10313 [Tepidibacillus fermentans]